MVQGHRLALGSALGLLLLTSVAGASSTATPTAAAEILFAEGRKLMASGRYAEACAKFRESQELDAGIGTLMNLGRCYAKQGLTASAWATYKQAAALAGAAGQASRERVARREADALEKDLARIEIRITTLTPGIRVTLDGMPVERELWNLGTPADPGAHRVTATAPGREAWSSALTLEPGELETVRIPVLPAVPAARRAAPERTWTSQHTMAVVQAGLGLAATALGAALAYSARSDYDDAPGCTSTACTTAGFHQREQAITKSKIATVSFVVGGAALAGASMLWFFAPPLGRSQTDATAGSESLGLELSGTW